MIRERVSTDPSVKYARWIRILLYRTKVEYPEVRPMMMGKKFIGVFSAIPVKT
jgi:hypothetical protein